MNLYDVVCCYAVVAIVAANHDKFGQGSYRQTGIRQEFQSFNKKPFRSFLFDLAPFETHRTLQQKACHKGIPSAFCSRTHAYKARGSLALTQPSGFESLSAMQVILSRSEPCIFSCQSFTAFESAMCTSLELAW